jgi:hypothetical protein
LERGISLDLRPLQSTPVTATPPASVENPGTAKPTLELAASALMAKVAAEAQKQSGGKVQAVSMSQMRRQRAALLVQSKEITA